MQLACAVIGVKVFQILNDFQSYFYVCFRTSKIKSELTKGCHLRNKSRHKSWIYQTATYSHKTKKDIKSYIQIYIVPFVSSVKRIAFAIEFFKRF